MSRFLLTKLKIFVKWYLTNHKEEIPSMKTVLILTAVGLSLTIFIVPLFILILFLLEGPFHSRKN